MARNTVNNNREMLRLSNEESNRFTKECIETALLVLMTDKNFNDISITDIVERAGVSRSAYYRNYSSKKDILNKYLNTIVETITDSLDLQKTHPTDFNFWLSVFTRVQTYADEFIILQKAGFDAIILSSINKTMTEHFESDSNNIFEKYQTLFWVGAFYNLLREWIISGMKESNEEMAKIGQKIANNFPHLS